MESVKNKQPAPMQITAEQILREARERQEDDAFQAPAQKVRAHAGALAGGRQGGGSRTRGRQGVDRQPAHLSAGAARPRAIGAAQLRSPRSRLTPVLWPRAEDLPGPTLDPRPAGDGPGGAGGLPSAAAEALRGPTADEPQRDRRVDQVRRLRGGAARLRARALGV